MSYYSTRPASVFTTSSAASSTTVLQTQTERYRHSAEDQLYAGVPSEAADSLSDRAIESLPDSICKIHNAFRDIAADLARYERGIESKRQKFLSFISRTPSLTDRWKTLRKTFTKLLDDSSSHAMKAYAVLHQYGNIYQKREAVPALDLCQSLKQEVQNLRQAIQDNQETSKEIRGRFSRFCDEVCTFNLDMERAYELAEHKGRLVHDECARASARLEALERELRTIAEKIAENDIAFSASLAHCLLRKHLPDVKAKAQLEAETTKQRKAVDKLQQERDRLFELDKSVDKIVNVLREFANNANALVNAWEAIINQFSELDALLETVVCGEHVTSFFGTKLDITHDAYEKLKDMLYKYSRALAGRTRY